MPPVSLSEQVFAAIARQVQEKAIEAPVRNETENLWEYFHRKDSEFWDARNRLAFPCFVSINSKKSSPWAVKTKSEVPISRNL